MNGLLVAVLTVPLLGALGVVVSGPRAPHVTVASGLVAAAGWGVIVSASSPPELGRISIDPVLAAALTASALLVAARRPASILGSCAALCGVTLLAATAGAGGEGLPDRPLAAGVLALTLLTVIRLRAESHLRLLPVAGLLVGGLLVALAASVDDPARAAVAVVAGAGLVVAVALGRDAPGALLVPAALLAVARVLAEVRAAEAVDGEVAAVAAGVAGVVAVLVAWSAHRTAPRAGDAGPADDDGDVTRGDARSHPRPTDRAGAAAAMAAVVLLAQDLPGAHAAGLLLAAGAVAAFVTTHPVGLVALLPGLVATLEAFGPATEPVHAAAGAAVVLLAGAASLTNGGRRAHDPGGPSDLGRHWPAAVAAAFGVVPLWGWSTASLDDLVRAVGTAVAFALPFAVGALALASRSDRRADAPAAPAVVPTVATPPDRPAPPRARRVLTAASARPTGRISARRDATASSDGSSHQDRS